MDSTLAHLWLCSVLLRSYVSSGLVVRILDASLLLRHVNMEDHLTPELWTLALRVPYMLLSCRLNPAAERSLTAALGADDEETDDASTESEDISLVRKLSCKAVTCCVSHPASTPHAPLTTGICSVACLQMATVQMLRLMLAYACRWRPAPRGLATGLARALGQSRLSPQVED